MGTQPSAHGGRHRWEAWARDQGVAHGLSALQAHVLLVLATFCNDAGECRPGREKLAACVRRDERWVGEALSDLARLGLIERRRRGPGKTAITRLRQDRTPMSGQPDETTTSGQHRTATSAQDQTQAPGQDPTPTSPKTGQPRLARPDAGAPQNPKKNPQKDLGNPSPDVAGRAHAPDSPNPGQGEGDLDHLAEQVWAILSEALDWLGPNDHGRPWPQPKRDTIQRALAEHRPEPGLARNLALETKAAVQEQNRAPAIASLWAKKVADAMAERTNVRRLVRDSLASTDVGKARQAACTPWKKRCPRDP